MSKYLEMVRKRKRLIEDMNYSKLQEYIEEIDSNKKIDGNAEADKGAVQAYNATKKKEEHKLRLDLRPCPLEGDISTARVVLLLANPQFTGVDSKREDHVRKPEFDGWGIFGLHNDAAEAMQSWWRGTLGELKEHSELKDWKSLSNKVAALQLYPWASKEFDSDCYLPSSMLMMEIAHEFCKRDVLFVIARQERRWNSILYGYDKSKILKLNSYRQSAISEGNTSKAGWKTINKALDG